VVRRPADARPGAAAPWDDLPAQGRRGLTLGHLTEALAQAGQVGDAPLPPPDAERPAAVLVALFESDGELFTVLTRRADSLRSHSGEVSFPGGRIEPGETVFEAACREAVEEVALDERLVEPAGWLHPLSTTSFITPVVATLATRPVLVANHQEVARVFEVPLADLVSDGAYHEECWSGSYLVKFFDVAGETVWGATARVLFELCCLVLGILPAPGIVRER